MAVLPVVPGHHVPAEVAGELAPNRMAVVVAVLRVVVFDQELRRLDAVVVAAARLDRAGPGEEEPVPRHGPDQRLAPLGLFGGHGDGVLVGRREQQGVLLLAERGGGHAARLAFQLGARVRRGEDVAVRLVADQRLLPQAGPQRAHQRAAGVFPDAQGTHALARAFPDLVGIGSEESRRGRDQLPVPHQEVQRHVVPFQPPGPGPLQGGLPEHAEMVDVDIAPADRIVLLDPENLLQAHDRLHPEKARPGERDAQQGVRQRALLRRHGLVGEAVAAVAADLLEVVVRHEVPDLVVGIVQLELGGSDLVAVQRGEPGLGGLDHQVFGGVQAGQAGQAGEGSQECDADAGGAGHGNVPL